MPWNNPPGGNGGNRGPWGRGPSGGGRPPDLPEIVRRGREHLRGLFPGGPFSAGALAILILGFVVVWLCTGIYFVSADEEGVVIRFGKFVALTSSGMHYHLPWPIETVEMPKVTRENQLNIGYRAAGDDSDETGDVPQESLMLTGDENIVDVNFTVFWVIKNAGNFLFNVENPQGAIKAVAESAMREIVGQNQIEPILTQDRGPVQVAVRELMQKTLDSYGAGVTITRVQMQKVDPPTQVIDAYRDVQAARADQERMRNEAEAYANKIIPEARGRAAKIVQDAEAYKQQNIAEASGEAARFVSVYDAYRKSPDVTRRRIYLETMSQILGEMNKVIIDEGVGKGVVPYLPLPALQSNQNSGVSVTSSPAQPAQSARSGGGGE